MLASRDWLRGPVLEEPVQGAVLKPEEEEDGRERPLGSREGEEEEEEEEEVAEGGG